MKIGKYTHHFSGPHFLCIRFSIFQLFPEFSEKKRNLFFASSYYLTYFCNSLLHTMASLNRLCESQSRNLRKYTTHAYTHTLMRHRCVMQNGGIQSYAELDENWSWKRTDLVTWAIGLHLTFCWFYGLRKEEKKKFC